MLSSKLLVMFLCTLLGRHTYSSSCARNDKVQMTLMSFKPHNSESTSDPLPHYECYLGAGDEDATITAVRAYRTSRLSLAGPTSVNPINDLPAHSVTLQTTGNGAFGVFNCTAVKDGRQNTTIMTIFLRSNPVMWPADGLFTQTVNTGDSGIIINMTPRRTRDTFWWRINGSDHIRDPSRGHGNYESQDYGRIPNPVSDADNGLYECHFSDAGSDGGRTARHAMQRLIVRACLSGKWGPPGCTGICDYCYNGGVCDDETGRCICSPGFMGTNCLEACGGNQFGYSCEFECVSEGDDDSCIRRLFCLLDPFGCRCNTGFNGLSCNSRCSSDKFGSNCQQSCQCSGSNGRCDSYTGVCESGNCAVGWSGTNCRIPDVCPMGYYGNDCTNKCRCKDDSACDKSTGVCGNGCAPGSTQDNNGVCQECPDGYYGDSCMEECHCEADACDKGTGECVGCCNDRRWYDNPPHRCFQGLVDSSFTKVNPGQPTEVTCTADVSFSVRIHLSSSPNNADLISTTNNNLTTATSDRPGLARLSQQMTVNSTQLTEGYYCLLLGSTGANVLAWLETSFSTYVLPTLSSAPVLVYRNQTSITISWRAWEDGTDVGDPPVVGYTPNLREGSGDWEVRANVSSLSDLQYSFTNLETDRNYSFSIAADRELTGGQGPRGPAVTLKTLCDAPSPPFNIQSEVITDTNQLNISWEVPAEQMCSTGISGYTVYYRKEGTGNDDVQSIDVPDGSKTWAIVMNLDPGATYEFSVSLRTDIESEESELSAAVFVPTPPSTTPPPGPDGSIIPIIIAVVVVVLILLIILVIFIIVRRKRKTSPKPRSDAPSYVNQVMTDVSTHNTPNPYKDTGLSHSKAPDGSQYEVTSPVQPTPAQQPGNGGHYEVTGVAHTPPTPLKPIVNKPQPRTPPKPLLLPTTPALSKKEPVEEFDEQDNERILPDSPMGETVYANVPRAIPVAELAAYYHNNKKVGLIEEFNLLKKNKQHPWTVATKEENKKKNRFKDLYAYDHCRVVLVPLEEDKHSDYYNASHVLDQEGKKTFIGSQAPNSGCINHFWRMIWQQEVSTIIMLSNLIENGKDRCTQYWPDSKGKSRAFGSIMVSWSSTLQFADFEVRVLEILLDSELRRVYQLHYTTWPDMDVPRDPAPLMELIQHSKRIQGNNTKPVVVHCSAGVGRTGTFIALHCLMEVIKKEKRINVFEFVETMRKNRVNMVQKEGQYVFIYRCLVDYYQTRHTEIPTGLLTQFNIDSKRNTLIEEFNLLNSLDEPGGSKMMDDGEASKKNRFQNTGPNDMGKVYLSSQASSGFSNYINATLYRSLRKTAAFITTQHPLPNTIEDFWRLVYDWNCSTIVMLNQLDARDKTAAPYWPEEGSSQYGNMSVSFKDSQNRPEHTLRQFEVAHITQQKCLSVTQLQLLSWSDGPSFTGLRELQRSVTLSHTSPGPILVQCIDGIGRSSIYVAAQSALIQAEVSDTVDVFSSARQMRQRNSNVIQEEDDYVLCYRVLQDLLQGNSDYQNLQSGAGRR